MNLLIDPVFRAETPDGMERFNLPQLLEALGQDRVESLLGLQRHQEDAFHIFLCYLAGAVLVGEDQTDPAQTAEFWREGIRRLTGREDDCAWTLVVEDVTLPAFMQPPVLKKADFAAFKPKAKTPDALDVLPTAKNHDVKSSKSSGQTEDVWIYALVSLQTMSGFFGQGNYGIARMNGGFGSRAMVSLGYGQRLGGCWSRDMARLLGLRGSLLNGPWGYRDDGLVLLWTAGWDLQSSFGLKALDPFFIEIARAVRLESSNGVIAALGASTKAPRVAATDTGGVLGDPWTPINRNDKKKGQSALTVSATGLTPELLRNLIFADGYEPADMQLADAGHEGQGCRFNATVLVRGQGTTDGFHHAAIPVPAGRARRLFNRSTGENNRLAELSKEALQDAREMQNRVLKTALFSLLEGGRNTDKIDWEKREVKDWWKSAETQFNQSWADDFFPWLWRQAEQEDKSAARLEWLKALRDKARAVLDDALARYPARAGRHYRAHVKADGLFTGMLLTLFPELKENAHDANHPG
jgi:CRISPR system Cascade subunit CasA